MTKFRMVARTQDMTRRSCYKTAVMVDENNNGSISRQELSKYIASNAKLWALLAERLHLPDDHCRDIATSVAFKMTKTLGSHKNIHDLTDAELLEEPTVMEMAKFLDFVKTTTGSQEFFHRTVFCVFDKDENGYLDLQELDSFLDIFYEANSVFRGNVESLPPKFMMKLKVMVQFDANLDGKLDYEEVKTLIANGAESVEGLG